MSVFSNAKEMQKLAAELKTPEAKDDAAHATDIDTIMSPARRSPWPFWPLMAARIHSVAEAKETYARGYTPSALGDQLAESLKHPKLYKGSIPKGFELSQIGTARICNVILVSYNANHDAALERRFQRALHLLREKCH